MYICIYEYIYTIFGVERLIDFGGGGGEGGLRLMGKLNLANAGVVGGLRARSSLRQEIWNHHQDDDDSRPWRRRLLSSMAVLPLSCSSLFRFSLFLLLFASIAFAFISLPVEKILKDFLLWIKQDLGPWGPLVLAIAYIPLTVCAVPASVLTLGGGYLFGLPVGFFADSIGATLGATAAFLLGRTIGRSYVISKLKNYPKFHAVAIAIQRSGFKYMLASWVGMMPITFALVYVGTTLKDLSDVTHGWAEVSTTRWVLIAAGFMISVVILMVYITKVAKASLDKALAENGDIEGIFGSEPRLPIVAEPPLDIQKPFIIKIDSPGDHRVK
ncbi:unnamed protein product [Camellia sinensis]